MDGPPTTLRPSRTTASIPLGTVYGAFCIETVPDDQASGSLPGRLDGVQTDASEECAVADNS